ncbi:hypothetical protein HOL21_00085 [Candidatus Woesearchaeota archaeon]|nr:hypothetical protein [Candidatus Woesearchaeota archaeon]MBT5396598.1 hypothetical protein [Candidatus Woesearchaeota archaeon]MBT6367992.1 hypothetical protein [Candidatus Woesearchaeota archaeon]MBT7762236.1 hypothetical protein [Candidatus Woesearchaeota archaeon]
MVVFTNVKKESVEKLKGFTKEEPKTVYEEVRMKKNGATLILYTSGKLLVQGNEDAVANVSEQLHKHGIGEATKRVVFKKETGTIIGSDESLKGDTFGGIVVAAVRADNMGREKLRELGVADSKKLRDTEIVMMAKKIRQISDCYVKSILPEEYNKFDGNVTKLLDKFHVECAHNLGSGTHVVDKYPGCTIGDVSVEKAESKYVEVAAASILARESALRQINYLSKVAGFPIPKGSTHVKLALHELEERKLDPNKFVKTSFSNVKEFFKHKKVL